jgi:hypothetical protein
MAVDFEEAIKELNWLRKYRDLNGAQSINNYSKVTRLKDVHTRRR